MTDATSGVPRSVLGLVWLLAALVVGGIGWLLGVLSERGADRAAGWILVAAAVVAAVAAVLVFTGSATRPLVLAASALFVVAGVIAAVLMLADGTAFASDVLLAGGVPVIAGLVTGFLARGVSAARR